MDTNNPTPPPVPTPPSNQAPPPTGEKNTGMSILSYLGILVIVPLLVAKDDPYVKFHAKQGLVLLILFIICSILGIIPMIGWILGALGWIFAIILMIIGIMNAASGKEVELPVIGQFAKNFNF